jgi:hypothetical protein
MRLADIRETIKGMPDISWDIFWVGAVTIVATTVMVMHHDWQDGEGSGSTKPPILVTDGAKHSAGSIDAVQQATLVLGAYVASQGGTTYHLPWCSGAKRIKPENTRWFQTKAEAEAAGLRPAKNCKGI